MALPQLATGGILFIVGPCVHLCMCDQACVHDVLQTARENFTIFTTWVKLVTKNTSLDFEVKRSKPQR